jgi:hypothetical protein
LTRPHHRAYFLPRTPPARALAPDSKVQPHCKPLLERRLGEVRSAPVRWVGISRVVAPLRVATSCYTMEQRTLLGRGVSTPMWCRRAAFEGPESSLMGRLLRRTSENYSSTHSGELGHEEGPGWRGSGPFSSALCSFLRERRSSTSRRTLQGGSQPRVHLEHVW